MSMAITPEFMVLAVMALAVMAAGISTASRNDGFFIGQLAGGFICFFAAGALFSYALKRLQPEEDMVKLTVLFLITIVLFEAVGFLVSAGIRMFRRRSLKNGLKTKIL